MGYVPAHWTLSWTFLIRMCPWNIRLRVEIIRTKLGALLLLVIVLRHVVCYCLLWIIQGPIWSLDWPFFTLLQLPDVLLILLLNRLSSRWTLCRLPACLEGSHAHRHVNSSLYLFLLYLVERWFPGRSHLSHSSLSLRGWLRRHDMAIFIKVAARWLPLHAIFEACTSFILIESCDGFLRRWRIFEFKWLNLIDIDRVVCMVVN